VTAVIRGGGDEAGRSARRFEPEPPTAGEVMTAGEGRRPHRRGDGPPCRRTRRAGC